MAIVKEIKSSMPILFKKKRVAAYARVSMESTELIHSLSAQVSYYSSMIQKNPDWEYAGVYADAFVSGTKTEKRQEFKRMISDCEAGRIDVIFTKSISRFARNTVDLLETVRHLRELGVEVKFERENISSLSREGELMLTILASFAQEESRSISENVKWGVRKRYEQGIPNGHFRIFGYVWKGETLVVEPEEAEIVKYIFESYLKGATTKTIKEQLDAMGVISRNGISLGESSISTILRNITYTGNLLFQKMFITDPIVGKEKVNHGELPQYLVENDHEAIISMEVYQAAQLERQRRYLEYYPLDAQICASRFNINTTCFTSKLKCGNCGKSYRRTGKRQGRKEGVYYSWICRTYSTHGKSACAATAIPEQTLKAACAEVLGLASFDERTFEERIKQIVVIGDDTLRFDFTDGTSLERKWKSMARYEWWTEERRRARSECRRRKSTNPNRAYVHEFAGFLECGCCGNNYQGKSVSYKDGGKDIIWRCSKHCGNKSIKDQTMKQLVCDTVGLAEFSEEQMDAAMDRAVIQNGEVAFYFKNGRVQKCAYHDKRKGPTFSDEQRKQRSTRMKRIRKERGGSWRKKE